MKFKPKYNVGILLLTSCAVLSTLIPSAHSAPTKVAVQVPAGMNGAPFDVQRYLTIPGGYTASVWARVPNARFMAFAPNGDLLVSEPGQGKVMLLRPTANGAPQQFDFATGLRLPHDIVFHTIGGTTYLYISESHEINRYIYTPGDTTGQNRQVIVTGLPDASTPELHGSYGHQLKNIALGPDDKLYVSSASATNASPSDVNATPPRAAIFQYNADGTGVRVFARGLRNAEGLAFVPGTNELWASVNNRDNVPYPYNDSTGWYGQVITQYVDNYPPDEFTHVSDGANYGWPYANPNPAKGMDDMPFDPDYDNNRDWGLFPPSTFTSINKGIQAHSAALGLTFTQGTSLASSLGVGALIAYHGSWDRDQATGYKIAFFQWQSGKPGAETDLVTGWLDGDYHGSNAGSKVWGRPVDTAISANGDLYISDDKSGTIYRLAKIQTPGDTTPPKVSITTPANTAYSAQVTSIEGSANDVGTYVARVRVSVARLAKTGTTTAISERSAALSNATGGVKWVLATGDLAEGQYRATAIAYDNAGNKATTQSTFFVDHTAPTVLIETPATNATLTGAFTATGTATDTGSYVRSVKVRLEHSGTTSTAVVFEQFAALSSEGSGVRWKLNIAALSAGSYTLQATALDASGRSTVSRVSLKTAG